MWLQNLRSRLSHILPHHLLICRLIHSFFLIIPSNLVSFTMEITSHFLLFLLSNSFLYICTVQENLHHHGIAIVTLMSCICRIIPGYFFCPLIFFNSVLLFVITRYMKMYQFPVPRRIILINQTSVPLTCVLRKTMITQPLIM